MIFLFGVENGQFFANENKMAVLLCLIARKVLGIRKKDVCKKDVLSTFLHTSLVLVYNLIRFLAPLLSLLILSSEVTM